MPDHSVPHPDVAGYVLGALEPDESKAFAEHLGGCAECRREVADLASLRMLLDQALPGPALPDGLAERTLAAVGAQAKHRPIPIRRPRRARLLPAVGTAVVAGAVALGLVVAAQPSGPAHRDIPLVAPDGTPSATVARLHRDPEGIVVELDVDGLAVPPPGAFYECWYVGEGDTPDRPARISAGTFTLSSPGPATVRMTTVADHERYPRIEITREPDDGDPRSTGPVVLRSPSPRERSATD